MELYQTKNGFRGQVKGRISGISFEFYALGENAKSVHKQLIFEVAKLCAYARLAAQ